MFSLTFLFLLEPLFGPRVALVLWRLSLWFFVAVFFNPLVRNGVLVAGIDREQDTRREAPPLGGGAHVQGPAQRPVPASLPRGPAGREPPAPTTWPAG